ncbi:MAG: hypothetical protein ACE15E_23975 [Acidobacteriota bacterium]
MPLENSPPATLAKLYPDLPPDQLRDAQDNLDRYLGVVFRIHTRILGQPGGSESGPLFDEPEALS